MGCGKKDHDGLGTSKDNCICQVVRAIKDIQDNVIEEDCECPKNCFNEPLGALSPATNQINTRVFVLKTADGSPFHAFYEHVTNTTRCFCVSIFFRVEEVFDNCCATLRVLRPTGDSLDLVENGGCCINLGGLCGLDLSGFEATEDCVTVDLSCFCAIQCITDTHLDIPCV